MTKKIVTGKELKNVRSLRVFTDAREPYPCFENFRVGEKCCSNCEGVIKKILIDDSMRIITITMFDPKDGKVREKISVGFNYSYTQE